MRDLFLKLDRSTHGSRFSYLTLLLGLNNVFCLHSFLIVLASVNWFNMDMLFDIFIYEYALLVYKYIISFSCLRHRLICILLGTWKLCIIAKLCTCSFSNFNSVAFLEPSFLPVIEQLNRRLERFLLESNYSVK